MKIYLFSTAQHFRLLGVDKEEIILTLNRVAEETDTSDLVVALYLLRGAHHSRGTAYVRNWVAPANFLAKQGKWGFAKRWGIPQDLPQRFKLIRMRLDGNSQPYPKKETDIYNWEFWYDNFSTHLAILFAHELHHFRRHHLGFHTAEGEHSANRWALQHVQNLGFRVEARRKPRKRKSLSAHSSFLKKFSRNDPYASFRKLRTGAHLSVAHDSRGQYLSETVTVLRPIRSNSKRIVVQTSDGKRWRWPMAWLNIIDEKES